MKPLSLLVKPVSADCNLRCEYCFYCERPSDPYDFRERHCMGDDTLAAMIQQYMPMVGQFAPFAWQGGEPMLAGLPFFERVIEYQKRYGLPGQVVSNAIQTNAVLIDDAWAELFAAYKFLAGVSLDGPQEDHDYYRRYRSGRGTFKHVMESIEVLRRHKVEFNVLSVLTPRTVSKAQKLYSFFVAQQIRFLQFIPCIEADISTGAYADFAVTSDQYGAFLCELFDLWYNEGRPQVSIRLFDNVLQAYAGMEPETCSHKQECGQYVVVEHNGDVYPCDFFVERAWLLGNLTSTPLSEIAESPLFRRFARQKAGPFDECVLCTWQWLCRNGCPRFRYLPHGDFSDRHSHCEAFKRFFAHSADRFEELARRIKEHEAREATAQASQVKGATQRARVGRNDPCPCGSGKKYKRCCMTRQAS